MYTKLGRIIILVDDYDKAFTFYEQNFSCRKIFDQTTAEGQRFLHISFSSDNETGIWFLKPDTNEQKSIIGKQTGGQPTIVVYTNNIESLYENLHKNQVKIIEELVTSSDAKFFHCLDLYGNRITVVEMNDPK
jgi:predicted enzyme related to lactoylglutathione lyase